MLAHITNPLWLRLPTTCQESKIQQIHLPLCEKSVTLELPCKPEWFSKYVYHYFINIHYDDFYNVGPQQLKGKQNAE